MVIGAAGHDINAARLQSAGKCLSIGHHGTNIISEGRLQRLAKRHCLGRNDVHQRPSLKARKQGRIHFLADGSIIAQDHTAARPAQSLVRGAGNYMGVRQGARMSADRDQASDMRHVNMEIGVDGVSNGPKNRKINLTRISRRPCNNKGGTMLFG